MLAAPRAGLAALAAFYGERLGLPVRATGEERVSVAAGDGDVLELAAASAGAGGDPFHHFALLVPGDRFDAARAWLDACGVELLGAVVDFPAWEARACYFHDPAGNIAELIAHRGIGEGSGEGDRGTFTAAELLGISEVGIVCPRMASVAGALRRDAGLELWDGAAPEDDRGLAFLGRRAHTVILCPPGRGWMPTCRPAEPHAAQLTLVGADGRATGLAAGRDGVRIMATGPSS